MFKVTPLRRLGATTFPDAIVGQYTEIAPPVYFDDERKVENYVSFLKERYKKCWNQDPIAVIERPIPRYSVKVKLYD